MYLKNMEVPIPFANKKLELVKPHKIKKATIK
jgi:hypothetical protein